MLWGAGLCRRHWLLHVYVAAYLALNAGFFVLSRYRFPAVIGLSLFAGFALVRLQSLAAGRSWLKAGALALSLAACFWISRLPLIGSEDMAVTHYSMGVIYANQGWKDKAVDEYQLSLQADPGFVPSYLNLGLLQAERGKAAEAIWSLERAAELETNPEQIARLRNAVGQLRAAAKAH